MLLRDGLLTEGAASNIFVVKDGVLLSPPKSNLILPGITYDVILELAQAHGIPCEVREVSEAEVRSAQELWLTSSTREVLAITTLDGKPVGDGRPGPGVPPDVRAVPGGQGAGSAHARSIRTPCLTRRLIEYPLDFPIKIMGKNEPGFANAVVAIVRRHAPDFDRGDASRCAGARRTAISASPAPSAPYRGSSSMRCIRS